MNIHGVIRGLAMGGLALAMGARSEAASPPLVVIDVKAADIGTLGGNNAAALDINDASSIVGWSQVSWGPKHAFYYKGGTMYDVAPAVVTGDSEGKAINRREHIAINGFDTVTGWHGYRWVSGIAYPLADASSPSSPGTAKVHGLNDRKIIVGERKALPPYLPTSGIAWLSDTSYLTLTFGFTGFIARATDVNNNDLAVGREPWDHLGRRWRIAGGVVVDTVITPEPGADYDQASPQGINGPGQIVGTVNCCFSSLPMTNRAWYWDGVSAVSEDLGLMPGGTRTAALDINDQQFVAGYGDIMPSGPRSILDAAFLYHRDFGFQVLESPWGGGYPCRADALNNYDTGKARVQVVGSCTKDGTSRAVRWDVIVK
jgi:probable HAF family extracellular repeat protein